MAEFLAVIYSDRSYPEGDDVCIAQIPFTEIYEQDGKSFIKSTDGCVYSLSPVSWFGNVLHAKHLEKIT